MILYPVMLVKTINQSIPSPLDAPRPFLLQLRGVIYWVRSIPLRKINPPTEAKKPETCAYFRVIKSCLLRTAGL